MPAATPNRAHLTLSLDALAANYRALARLAAPARCGAAIKADAYGLGLEPVARRLLDEGCRDFFVATWGEAAALRALAGDVGLHVLNGLSGDDVPAARALAARPVLCAPEQLALWRAAGAGHPCDVMVDTGINRLGIPAASLADADLDGLTIDVLASHLACADDPPHPLNRDQAFAFSAVRRRFPAGRYSLANSAGILLGADYHHDLVRPGLSLYGGIPVDAARGHILPVLTLGAEVLQVKTVPAGATVGYNATWTADRPTRVATLGLGYADGYPRSLTNRGWVGAGDRRLPVIGRVSMDLVTVDATSAPDLVAGNRVDMLGGAGPSLATLAELAGISQYELLTGLGSRYERTVSGQGA